MSAPRARRQSIGVLLLVLGLTGAPACSAALTAGPTLTAPSPGAPANSLAVLAARLRAQPVGCVPFVQTKHLLALPRPLTFSGGLTIGADGVIDWRLLKPLAVQYRFSARGAWRKAATTAGWESLGLPGAASTAAFRVLAALVSLDLAALQQYFTVGYSAGPPVRIDAIPKDPRLRSVIARAVVEVGARVERVEIREANGDWSEYRFGGVDALACAAAAAP